jgi:GntR family transcriptional regulator
MNRSTSTHNRKVADAKSSVALYRQLADTLRTSIESGKLRENEPLPTERDLAVSYEMSRDTVRKALRLLETQGILYSDHGRGTFVAPQAVRHMSRFLDSFSADTIRRGGVPGQRILSIENSAASMAIASILKMDPDSPVWRIRRIRLVNDQPVGLQDSYLRLPAGATLEQKELERSGSLYRLLIDKFGSVPTEGLESVSAVAATADDAVLLGVAAGTPLLLCERVTLSERREPVEYCEMRYLPSYRYKTRVSKWSSD